MATIIGTLVAAVAFAGAGKLFSMIPKENTAQKRAEARSKAMMEYNKAKGEYDMEMSARREKQYNYEQSVRNSDKNVAVARKKLEEFGQTHQPPNLSEFFKKYGVDEHEEAPDPNGELNKLGTAVTLGTGILTTIALLQ